MGGTSAAVTIPGKRVSMPHFTPPRRRPEFCWNTRGPGGHSTGGPRGTDMAAARLARLTRRAAAPADPDRELVARFAAARDEEAFAELVRRYGPLVFGVCRR